MEFAKSRLKAGAALLGLGGQSASSPAAGAAAAASSSPPVKSLDVIVYSSPGDTPNIAKSIIDRLEDDDIAYATGSTTEKRNRIPRTGPVVVFCCSNAAYINARNFSPNALFIVYKQTIADDNSRKGDSVFYYQWDSDGRPIKDIIGKQAAECAAAAKLRDAARQVKRSMQTQKVHTTDQALQHLNIGPAKPTRAVELTTIRLTSSDPDTAALASFGKFTVNNADMTAPLVYVVDVPTGSMASFLFPGEVPPADIYLARSDREKALWELVPAWQKKGSNVYALPHGATDAQTRAIILVAARRLPFVPPSSNSLNELAGDMSELMIDLFPPAQQQQQ